MLNLLWLPINLLQAIYTALWTSGWITAALIVRAITGSPRIPLAMARRGWAPGLLAGGLLRVETVGGEDVDFSRPHIFAANHQSLLDIPILYCALPVPLLFIVKEELRRVPFLGWYISAMGMIFICRQARQRSLRDLEACRSRLAEGNSILMFPEGTRSQDGRIGDLKPGSFVPAIDIGAPVVPILIDGSGKALPAGGFRVRHARIRVVIGAPIRVAGLARKDRRHLAEEVRSRLLELERELDCR
ncbi:MAG: lysophospholipid acyltransferase family protein [Acidobacteriota bacterium]